MYLSAIVAAAGDGKRFKAGVSKVLLKINSRPMIAYSLETLDRHPLINEIIVVANSKNAKELSDIIRQKKISKPSRVVLGGKERRDSVFRGLEAINPKADFVLIHDGARPFITKGLISSVIKEARNSKAAILGVPVKPTIKEVKSKKEKGKSARRKLKDKLIVEKTLDRERLWEVQTPQVFEKKLIFEAYQKFGQKKVTDDAALVEKLGKPVKIAFGSYWNIKITTPEDLILAQVISRQTKGLIS